MFFPACGTYLDDLIRAASRKRWRNIRLVWNGKAVQRCHGHRRWRHVMTSQTLMYLSQHADVLEKWFFLFLWVLGHWIWKCYWIVFVQCCDVMTSYHDVTKPDLPISACRCPRKMIIILFPCFLGNWVQNCQRFFICMMSSCHDVMSWRHKVCFIYLGLWMAKTWFFLCFHGLTGCWFPECYHSCIVVMTSRHNVTS